jgi:tetratricopeptide (TPR) repeat protein
LVATSVRFGSPPTLVRRGYDAFTAPPAVVVGSDLNERLFSLSAGQRIPQWRVAWEDYLSHRWLGSGAGSYASYWARSRPNPGTVRNAHSLYLETLAELGPVGLTLLGVALAIPLGAAVRARWRSLVPAAAGAYVAFLVHVAGDWDWQLPAISLAALFCASALLVAARGPRTPRVESVHARLVAGALSIVIAGFAFVGLVGNSAVEASTDALEKLDLARAEAQAHKAAQWMPWSSLPWQHLAQAQLYRGERAAGLASLRKAIAKDRDNWKLWYQLALASSGAAQRHALREARRLAPLEPQVVSLSSQLASSGADG